MFVQLFFGYFCKASERVKILSGHDEACPSVGQGVSLHHLRYVFFLGKWRVAFHRDRLRNG